MTKSGYLAALLGLALLSLALFPMVAHAGEVKVQIKLATPDAVEVSYTLPDDCKTVPFVVNGSDGGKIRASWQAEDDCGTAGGDAISRSKDVCTALRFRVPVTASKVNGYYATAFPMGGGAVYVHTSTYAINEACGKVSYSFMAPGSIAMAGRVYQGEVSADQQSGGDMSVLLLPGTLPPVSGPISYFDPRMSPEAVAQIREVADGTVSFLRKALPDAEFKPPILAATLASEPGGPNVGGEASDVLRLSFYNWPQQPSLKERQKMTMLVAHELSHRFQLRDAVDTYPDARLIHEGGAEFLRWLVSVQKGWLTHEEAAQNLDDELAQCMLSTDQKSWRELTPRAITGQHLEYHCGLAAYVFALAARQGHDSALKRFNDFYKDLKHAEKPDFAQALECGSDTHCQARWLPLLLGNGTPMSDQWSKLFSETGLATPHAPNQSQRDAMMQNAIVKLMKDDCDGHSGITPTPDSILLDGMSVCKTFRVNAELTKIEGQPVFGSESALPTMISACTARHEVKLGMKNGDVLTVPCTTPYPTRSAFYGANIDKVLANLMRE